MSSTVAGLLQAGVLVLALALDYRRLGGWTARVYSDRTHWRVQHVLYLIVRVDPEARQRWTTYAGVHAVGRRGRGTGRDRVTGGPERDSRRA